MYKLYDWLSDKVSKHLDQDAVLVDVGAYHGDFSAHLLATKKFSKACLFEPNPEHFKGLQNKFLNDSTIHLFPYALGNEAGTKTFNCSQDDATGSLLQYDPQYHHESAGKTVNSFSVEVARLDDFYDQHFPNEKIGLIKIDTQGFDLEVLKGAEKIIRKYQPWLIIELNFLSFYTSQAPIHSVFNWLAECGYNLGALFNDYYSGDQWLAFADGVFIPQNTVNKVLEPFHPKIFSQELVDQNKYLQGVCDERLKLINVLNTEAENRLKIIEALKQPSTVQRLKSKVADWF